MRYPTIYADCWPLKDWQNGMAFGPLIFIREGYERDEGLYRHELVHVKQFWFSLGLYSLAWLVSKTAKMLIEVEAYQEQMKWPDRNGQRLTLDLAAHRLAKDYDLGITVDQARTALA